jgi:hypothetical protein
MVVFSNLVLAIVALGTLLSGVAAIGQLVANRKVVDLHAEVKDMRTDIDGRLTQLVVAEHGAGVAEGIAIERGTNGGTTPPA